jgi:hypothetical protein
MNAAIVLTVDDPLIPSGVGMLVLGALFPLYTTRLYRAQIRAKRSAAGRCPKCGYDLRATPECCPKCGTPRA